MFKAAARWGPGTHRLQASTPPRVAAPEGSRPTRPRRGYASFLIGVQPDLRTGQLGHTCPNITLSVYALYARADHATTARDAFEASYAALARSGRAN
jgi:hypothetical protein